jgi:hypothetical protein
MPRARARPVREPILGPGGPRARACVRRETGEAFSTDDDARRVDHGRDVPDRGGAPGRPALVDRACVAVRARSSPRDLRSAVPRPSARRQEAHRVAVLRSSMCTVRVRVSWRHRPREGGGRSGPRDLRGRADVVLRSRRTQASRDPRAVFRGAVRAQRRVLGVVRASSSRHAHGAWRAPRDHSHGVPKAGSARVGGARGRAPVSDATSANEEARRADLVIRRPRTTSEDGDVVLGAIATSSAEHAQDRVGARLPARRRVWGSDG